MIVLPQRKSAIKELRINRRRHMKNLDMKSELKKTVKKFLTSIKDKNLQEAQTNLNTVYKKLDKAAKNNIIHKNTAARRKSHFTKLLAKAQT